MGFDIGTAAYQTGSGLLGAGLGILMQKANDKRQIKQQQRLQAIQIGGAKEMTDYQAAKELQMWKDTNYAAQMEQLTKAGLNPGLIYGMSGGGGQTTGGGGQMPTGGNAPSGGGEIGMGLQMGLQTAMMQAQIENIKATTKKTEQEAANIGEGGIDTREKEGRIQNLQADLTTKGAQQAMMKVETTLKELDVKLKGMTIEDSANLVKWAAGKAQHEMGIAENEEYISDATRDTKVKQISADLLGTYLKNALTKAQTTGTKAQTEKTQADTIVSQQQAYNLAHEIIQKYQEIAISATNAQTQIERLQMDQTINNVAKSTGLTVETITTVVKSIADKLIPSRHIMQNK